MGRGWYHRVAGFIRACNHAGMCCIKAVGLHAACWRRTAVVTTLAAAAIATFTTLATLFTALTATLTLTFSAWLALTVASGVLRWALLALRRVTFVHGRSHGRLIRQCEILFLRVASRAVAAFTAFPAVTTTSTAAAFTGAL